MAQQAETTSNPSKFSSKALQSADKFITSTEEKYQNFGWIRRNFARNILLYPLQYFADQKVLASASSASEWKEISTRAQHAIQRLGSRRS